MPSVTEAPLRPTLPSKTWSRATTSRPVRAETRAATASRRWTYSPTLMAAAPRPCTDSPVRAWGVTWPSSVVKARSTTASSGKGLNTRSDLGGVAGGDALGEVPGGRRGRGAGGDAGARGARWWTAPRPPPRRRARPRPRGSRSGRGRPGGRTPARWRPRRLAVWAATPATGMTVMSARSGRVPALAITTVPSATAVGRPGGAGAVPGRRAGRGGRGRGAGQGDGGVGVVGDRVGRGSGPPVDGPAADEQQDDDDEGRDTPATHPATACDDRPATDAAVFGAIWSAGDTGAPMSAGGAPSIGSLVSLLNAALVTDRRGRGGPAARDG